MRKALIATIVAMVLFAVGAFAASFTLENEPLATDSASVVSCATATPSVDFKVGPYNSTTSDWPVTGATVTATGCTGGIEAEVVILEGSSIKASGTAPLNGGTAEVSFSTSTAAKPIDNYALRIGGVLVTGP